MDSPGALHRQDGAGGQGPLGQGDGVPGLFPAVAVQVEGPGPAHRAAVRLGMVTPALDVAVLGGAGGAHGKFRHGGVGPVIGQRPQDGKPRPAVGAVDERVPVPAVGGIVQLCQTGRAGGKVGGGQRLGSPGGAGQNDKPRIPAAAGQRLHLHLLHHRQRWRLGSDLADKPLDGVPAALQLQLHPGGGVAGPAGQVFPQGQPVQKRPEPHPLHNAGDGQMNPDRIVRSVHARAARIRPARCSLRASRPSPVRMDSRNIGPWGFTP